MTSVEGNGAQRIAQQASHTQHCTPSIVAPSIAHQVSHTKHCGTILSANIVPDLRSFSGAALPFKLCAKKGARLELMRALLCVSRAFPAKTVLQAVCVSKGFRAGHQGCWPGRACDPATSHLAPSFFRNHGHVPGTPCCIGHRGHWPGRASDPSTSHLAPSFFHTDGRDLCCTGHQGHWAGRASDPATSHLAPSFFTIMDVFLVLHTAQGFWGTGQGK
eukprot:1160457-Pelagomonas_calceolata.AAC.4